MGYTWVGVSAKTGFLASMNYRGAKVWGKPVRPVAVKRATKHIFDVKLKF